MNLLVDKEVKPDPHLNGRIRGRKTRAPFDDAVEFGLGIVEWFATISDTLFTGAESTCENRLAA